MNKQYIHFHLSEAHKELQQIIRDIRDESSYEETEFQLALEYLYSHINVAWNARNISNKESAQITDEDFFTWRAFPVDINL